MDGLGKGGYWGLVGLFGLVWVLAFRVVGLARLDGFGLAWLSLVGLVGVWLAWCLGLGGWVGGWVSAWLGGVSLGVLLGVDSLAFGLAFGLRESPMGDESNGDESNGDE